MQYLEGRFVYGDDVYTDDYHMDERWDKIAGFSDYYISDKGRVWSSKTKQFIKPKKVNKHGHLGVCLCKDGTLYYELLHRLVAKSFIPNPNNYPIVRHIYDQPDQNSYLDLEWGTQIDNMNDSVKNGNIQTKPIIAINTLTNNKKYFKSRNEAARLLNIPQSNILAVLRNKRYTAGGYKFKEVI